MIYAFCFTFNFFACVQACTRICVYAAECTCICRSGDNLECYSSCAIDLLLHQGLSLTWNTPSRPGSLSNESQQSTYLCLPALEPWVCASTIALFYVHTLGDLEIELKSSCLKPSLLCTGLFRLLYFVCLQLLIKFIIFLKSPFC